MTIVLSHPVVSFASPVLDRPSKLVTLALLMMINVMSTTVIGLEVKADTLGDTPVADTLGDAIPARLTTNKTANTAASMSNATTFSTATTFAAFGPTNLTTDATNNTITTTAAPSSSLTTAPMVPDIQRLIVVATGNQSVTLTLRLTPDCTSLWVYLQMDGYVRFERVPLKIRRTLSIMDQSIIDYANLHLSSIFKLDF